VASSLSALELASGLVLEPERAPAAPALPPSGDTPRAALERAVLPALLRPPCVVSFSGGRDSSAVLAVAAHVARREGLAPPVPVTNRFVRPPRADESAWQEAVVAHLGLQDWTRLDHGDELDCVGPVATAMLRRHGLLWPCNAHFHVPLLEQARGGSLLTGIGGDEALSPSPLARPADVLRRRVRPEPRDALLLAYAAAPRALRLRAQARRIGAPCSWLRPPARRALVHALAAEAAAEPLRWSGRYRSLASSRTVAIGLASLAALARDGDTLIAHPLFGRGVLAALGSLPPRRRFATREAATTALVGDLLPPRLALRRDKTGFDDVFWGGHSRAFAARWTGAGVDATLVDHDALRAEWTRPAPDPRSFLLLQAAWLAQAPVSSSRRLPADASPSHPRGRRRRHAGSSA
jgi:asparagine synthase (glutamine-hydrolysing)